MGLFRQMIGRVLRPAEGKTDAIVLDHSGAVFRHGFVEDEVCWTLDPDRRAESPDHESRKDGTTSRLKECPQCEAVMIAGEPCFNCGYMPAPRPRAVIFEDGELSEVGRDGHQGLNYYDRFEWLGMLTYICMERGHKRGWIAHKYKEKFGEFPAWGATAQPIPPTPEVRSWVRSRYIAYAKRRSA